MLQAGIVGLPNVGKSTLFNAVTRSRKAQTENYPFCTIDPNQGIVTVPDDRVETLSKITNSPRAVPAAIEFVDIAGLVKGASKGEGLGNQFLAHIREVDAIVQVVRCFESTDIHHVDGSVDPLRDIDVVNTELLLADLGALERRRERNLKKMKGLDKDARRENEIIDRLTAHLDAGRPAFTFETTEEERKAITGFFLLTDKPVIFACNVSEDELGAVESDPSSNAHVAAVTAHAKETHNAESFVVSAAIECELADLPEAEAAGFLESLGARGSGVSRLIQAVYRLLGLRTFLTTNEKESRAWTVTAGTTAPAAAGRIHTDFERGFIAAEVVAFDELLALGSTAKAREAGKLRVEGREYEVQDGDVIEFRFNV